MAIPSLHSLHFPCASDLSLADYRPDIQHNILKICSFGRIISQRPTPLPPSADGRQGRIEDPGRSLPSRREVKMRGGALNDQFQQGNLTTMIRRTASNENGACETQD